MSSKLSATTMESKPCTIAAVIHEKEPAVMYEDGHIIGCGNHFQLVVYLFFELTLI